MTKHNNNHDEITSKTKKLQAVMTKYGIGDFVCHRRFGFSGVVFDVDPEFNNSEEWYQSIPENMRPHKDQPFYHLFAVNNETNEPYIAYVSEQNLMRNADDYEDFQHPAIDEFFSGFNKGRFQLRHLPN